VCVCVCVWLCVYLRVRVRVQRMRVRGSVCGSGSVVRLCFVDIATTSHRPIHWGERTARRVHQFHCGRCNHTSCIKNGLLLTPRVWVDVGPGSQAFLLTATRS
jgi:hypothetical protein